MELRVRLKFDYALSVFFINYRLTFGYNLKCNQVFFFITCRALTHTSCLSGGFFSSSCREPSRVFCTSLFCLQLQQLLVFSLITVENIFEFAEKPQADPLLLGEPARWMPQNPLPLHAQEPGGTYRRHCAQPAYPYVCMYLHTKQPISYVDMSYEWPKTSVETESATIFHYIHILGGLTIEFIYCTSIWGTLRDGSRYSFVLRSVN